MQFLNDRFKSVREYSTRYPAFLSGLIIYSYLLFTILRYLMRAKSLNPSFYDILETFDALPFMWLLSVALVKIMDIRSKLYKSETERMFAQKQIELKQTQLNTLHEVVKSLQHHINNPLAIISLTLGSARRQAKGNAELMRQIDAIDESTQRIVRSMKDFFETQSYETEHVDVIIGSITALPSDDSTPQSPTR